MSCVDRLRGKNTTGLNRAELGGCPMTSAADKGYGWNRCFCRDVLARDQGRSLVTEVLSSKRGCVVEDGDIIGREGAARSTCKVVKQMRWRMCRWVDR